MVAAFVRQLFEDSGVTKVQTDPDPTNAQAIRCYEKAGFHAVGKIATPDGPAMLMVIERHAARGAAAMTTIMQTSTLSHDKDGATARSI